ncbi:maleylpyruvate isomerase family mycothiol-dependent enzyme [Nocardiopsis rhodophaea]|uniref:Maleylpyruvate isomerase family mycothiol-dependent enzyme n=1 Tax=Nocardiopsis rhodophaea TaxID=280238 RepID=A0ABN2S305_9ACTN
METADFIETLRRDGELLADFAVLAGWGTAVPTCPGWQVRDLVAHTGSVHRWAAGYLAGRTQRTPIESCAPKDDHALAAWFRDGHRELVEGLTAAPADLECWTFLPAPTPLAFWARRQAHETAVHRVDAERALGAEHREFTPEFARDGIDELLAGFHVRSRSQVRTEQPRTLLVRATDGVPDTEQPSAWLLRLSQEAPCVERLADPSGAPADCTVRGPSAALYLALWNRGRYEDLDVTGDASLVELWRRASAV